MEATRSTHPSDQILSDYGLGKLDDASAAEVNDHLEGCVDCRQRVAGFTSDSFLGRLREARKPSARSILGESLDPGSLSLMQGRMASPPPSADTLPAGLAEHLDYEIRRELGRGGMGVVYLAHNTMMGRDEVLKVMGRGIMDRPHVLERFQREIRAVARLRHPNIVMAYSAFRIEGGLVFAMEHVDGFDLAKLVKSKGPLPILHASYFIHQAALGLQHAHERGMIHRDIKPHNLMLTHDGKARVIKVLDFGLAKAVREEKVAADLTSEGQALGTPDYIAPEQIMNAVDVDIRADIYSLGGTLFFLLAGRPPFKANSLYDIYQAHMSRDVEPLNLLRPEVPSELAAIVSKMMAKEPARRFQTPGEVAEALKPFFKKGNAAFQKVEPQVSRIEQAAAGQPIAGLLPSAAGAAGSAVAAPNSVEPTDRGVRLGGLIEIRESEISEELHRVAEIKRRPPWIGWAVAASFLFGMIALGIIITITIKRKGDEKETSIVFKTTPSPDTPVADKPASPPVAGVRDSLQPKSVWTGKQTRMQEGMTEPQIYDVTLTVLERDGDSFIAMAETIHNIRKIRGRINKDGRMSWLAEDVEAIKGHVGQDHMGKLQGDELSLNYSGIAFADGRQVWGTVHLKLSSAGKFGGMGLGQTPGGGGREGMMGLGGTGGGGMSLGQNPGEGGQGGMSMGGMGNPGFGSMGSRDGVLGLRGGGMGMPGGGGTSGSGTRDSGMDLGQNPGMGGRGGMSLGGGSKPGQNPGGGGQGEMMSPGGGSMGSREGGMSLGEGKAAPGQASGGGGSEGILGLGGMRTGPMSPDQNPGDGRMTGLGGGKFGGMSVGQNPGDGGRGGMSMGGGMGMPKGGSMGGMPLGGGGMEMPGAVRKPAQSGRIDVPEDPKKRVAISSKNTIWSTNQGELVLGDGMKFQNLIFGDPRWQDYDYSFEVMKTSDSGEGFGALYHAQDLKTYQAFRHGVHSHTGMLWSEVCRYVDGNWTKAAEQRSNIHIEKNKWYIVRVEIRGKHITCRLDGVKKFDYDDDNLGLGRVGVQSYNSKLLFRDFKVVSPDGEILWEGVPLKASNPDQNGKGGK